MQRGRHDAIINKPPIIISAASYGRFPLWDRKLKTLLFLICLFLFYLHASFFAVMMFFLFFFCFILEGFQSNQITVVSPLIRHNRTLAGGERWREKSRESAFCKKKKKFGKKWITLSHYAPVSNIMLPIISRGLLRAKIKAKSNQTELCCVHIHHKLKGKNGPHVFSC